MAIWNMLQTFGIFYDHLVHFALIWYLFLVWVIFTKKNLATLLHSERVPSLSRPFFIELLLRKFPGGLFRITGQAKKMISCKLVSGRKQQLAEKNRPPIETESGMNVWKKI
jgi:hypothetical protein